MLLIVVRFCVAWLIATIIVCFSFAVNHGDYHLFAWLIVTFVSVLSVLLSLRPNILLSFFIFIWNSFSSWLFHIFIAYSQTFSILISTLQMSTSFTDCMLQCLWLNNFWVFFGGPLLLNWSRWYWTLRYMPRYHVVVGYPTSTKYIFLFSMWE